MMMMMMRGARCTCARLPPPGAGGLRRLSWPRPGPAGAPLGRALIRDMQSAAAGLLPSKHALRSAHRPPNQRPRRPLCASCSASFCPHNSPVRLARLSGSDGPRRPALLSSPLAAEWGHLPFPPSPDLVSQFSSGASLSSSKTAAMCLGAPGLTPALGVVIRGRWPAAASGKREGETYIRWLPAPNPKPTSSDPQTSLLTRPLATMGLSAEDCKLLQTTWAKVAPCMDKIGEDALHRMFLVYPQTKVYFPGFDMSACSSDIRHHGHKVIKAIDNALKHLDDIRGALAELSDLHAYNLRVDPVNFLLLCQCLQVVLAIHLRSEYSGLVCLAWDKFLCETCDLLAEKYR